ncbi:tetratricopeptide repeat protein [Pontibacter ruber]|uniref:Tetratricopeptide repeat protein n=1 Tax=Pontibacter ruber TaxID=1343895 RepID=A0ABW5CRT7_9BACT|nr:hypothetical protein [Pontibacter ruber]
MKKLFFSAVAFLIATTFTLAQEQQAQPDPKVLPMFGKIQKTEEQQLKDQRFLASCDASFTTRQEASNFFMQRGWEFFNEGQVDTAVYRFNLAWLLNQDNSDTYWAFGLVTAAKGKSAEAIEYYEKALTLQPSNSLLLSDVASAHLTLYTEKNKKKNLKQAKSYLERAIAADAKNAYALYTLSREQYYEKKYDEAWKLLHQAREIDLSHLDYAYLGQLMEKMPDPTGLFKNN